ncbi:protealysin inhibitor emfourin [Agromyces archimandritae]|uniref:Uncharacterized protein n=1 Tax=Agromyces archimandritae TaxID=2781962 RepID=A0A975FQ02_9MICO|nr:protealysin inhibitor emfourin [Agromyces archimandritae]QTX05071.1 hypothetical protein G127AT_02175 [Agromyces archimandritae]
MRLIVTRMGGIAGLRTQWDVDVDAQPDSADWEILIDTVPWDEVPPAPPEPDRYAYRIRCEPHEVTLQERQVRGPWRTLVDRAQETGERRRLPPAGPGARRPE